MANFAYNTGTKELWDTTQTIDLIVDDIIAMLCTASYVANRDDDLIDAGGANDAIDHELTGTGYTAGHGNSGRKTLASKTITVDKPNDRTLFDAADITWTAIDAGVAAQMIIHKKGAADDTTARPITKIDDGGLPITTNGGDLTFTFNVEGILQLRTV